MKKRLLIEFYTLIILLVLLTSFYSVYFIIKPQVSLVGEDEVLLTVNNQYTEPGVKATARFKDVSKKIVMVSNVNVSKPGTYKVTYKVKANHMTTEVTRTVKVIDNVKPVINLIGGENINVCPNAEYIELGYTANDNLDGDITSLVEVIKGSNFIIYKVKDKAKNEIAITRTFNKADVVKPIISLKGYQTLNIIVGSKYYESGYTVTDNCTSNLNNKVKITNNVNINSVGTYSVKYEVSDDSGNIGVATRTVRVINKPLPKDSTIYLTFDDGPSSLTAKVLDILKEENVKATFFVLNRSSSYDYLLKRIVNEGHTIALHGNTHSYSIAYASVNAYFSDIQKIHDKVLNITGVDSNIIRFIGGSSNSISKRFNPGIMTTLTKEALNRGYHYFDWNVCTADTETISPYQILNNVIHDLGSKSTYVVLQHDYEGNYNSVNTIRSIIRYGKEHGYKFDRITESTPQIHHRLNN